MIDWLPGWAEILLGFVVVALLWKLSGIVHPDPEAVDQQGDGQGVSAQGEQDCHEGPTHGRPGG